MSDLQPHCSLVAHTQEIAGEEAGGATTCKFVDFVSWNSVGTLLGRIFHADGSGCIKWSVPVKTVYKMQSFDKPDTQVILPDAGVGTAKPRGARPKIPDDVVKFKEMFEAAYVDPELMVECRCTICRSERDIDDATPLKCPFLFDHRPHTMRQVYVARTEA